MSHPRDACNGYNSITVLCVSVCVGRCKDCVCIGVCAANPPLAIGQRLIELISESGAGQFAIVAIGRHTPPTGIHPVLGLLILRQLVIGAEYGVIRAVEITIAGTAAGGSSAKGCHAAAMEIIEDSSTIVRR